MKSGTIALLIVGGAFLLTRRASAATVGGVNYVPANASQNPLSALANWLKSLTQPKPGSGGGVSGGGAGAGAGAVARPVSLPIMSPAQLAQQIGQPVRVPGGVYNPDGSFTAGAVQPIPIAPNMQDVFTPITGMTGIIPASQTQSIAPAGQQALAEILSGVQSQAEQAAGIMPDPFAGNNGIVGVVPNYTPAQDVTLTDLFSGIPGYSEPGQTGVAVSQLGGFSDIGLGPAQPDNFSAGAPYNYTSDNNPTPSYGVSNDYWWLSGSQNDYFSMTPDYSAAYDTSYNWFGE